MAVAFENFPPELTELPRWILWRGKKIPFRANDPSETASSTDSSTWDSFEAARGAYDQSRDGGLAFVITAQDGLACIDIDHNTGPEAVKLLREVGCKFIECSPSGNGLHGWGLFSGELPRKKGSYQGMDVEVYNDKRYMTVTGDVIDNGPFVPLPGIADLSSDLQKRTEVHRRSTEEYRGIQKSTDVIFSNLPCSSVGEFLPETEGQRNKRLFEMARYLKGINPDAGKPELRPIVQEWHRLAIPVIGTKDFSTTWTDFLRGWEKVKFPHGATLDSVLDGVVDDDVPDGFDSLGYGEKTILIAKICRRLAEHEGENPFFISARKAGELVNIHHTDAAKMLGALVADDVLILVKKGSGNVASRYRWDWTS